MDIQYNIELYHGALKKVCKDYGLKSNWLLYRLSNMNSNHYIYLMEKKIKHFNCK